MQPYAVLSSRPLVPSPNTRPNKPTAYSEAVQLQALLLKDANDPKVTAASRAQVARAWDILEERKRILRMRPKPKDIDVVPKSRKPRSFSEPIEPAKPTPSAEPAPPANAKPATTDEPTTPDA